MTTEALLRDALELDDAHHLFAWLRGLSFVEAGADGLFPHELARDVLDIDLRWRDPDAYKRHVPAGPRPHPPQPRDHARARPAARHLRREVRVPQPAQRAVSGRLDRLGRAIPRAGAVPRIAPPVLDLVARYEGPESADIAAHWLDRQRDGFVVIREPDGTLRGFLGLLDLTAASTADRAADPAAQAAWRQANSPDPVRAGEIVTQTRFVIDSQAYQAPSPTLNATPVATLQRYLQDPGSGVRLPHPRRSRPVGRLLRSRRPAPRQRRRLHCRQSTLWPVLPRLSRRARGRTVGAVDRTRAKPGAHARHPPALRRCWCCPSPTSPTPCAGPCTICTAPTCWRVSPCCEPACFANGPAPRIRTPRTLTRCYATPWRPFASDPRDDKLLRAVERTYLRPAATQEAAAALLGLPFSTYRRHLSQGMARVVSWCWEREVYGAAHEHK